MRFLMIPALLGVLALTDTAPAQVYPPPRTYPVPSQYYPDDPANLVRHWYRKYLNREGDPGGVNAWVNSLRGGNPPEATLATILASDEYLRKSGGTVEGLVQTLFLDLTGRQPPPREFGFWVDRFYRAERVDVIYDLLTRYPQDFSGPAPGYPDAGYSYERPYRYYRR